MNKEEKRTLLMFVRYFILLLVALPSFWVFYSVFTPLTIYPVYIFLNLLFGATIYGSTILLENSSTPIEIISACVAGSAYYLLLILNLSIPNLKLKKTLGMIGFAFVSFLIVNVLRIVLLSIIFVLKPDIFDISHKLSWYIGSIILVVAIWFVEVKKFKLKEIPFYSDIKSLLKYIK